MKVKKITQKVKNNNQRWLKVRKSREGGRGEQCIIQGQWMEKVLLQIRPIRWGGGLLFGPTHYIVLKFRYLLNLGIKEEY